MKKLLFSKYYINIIVGLLVLVASVLALIGKLAVPELDYISTGLYYVIGVLIIIFACFNLLVNCRKGCSKDVLILYIIINIALFIIGLLLIIAQITYQIPNYTPVIALSIAIYLEGVLIILRNALYKGKLINSIIGILIITLGLVCFIFKGQIEEIIIYSIIAALFIIGLFYLIFGLLGVPKKQKTSKTKKKKHEKN